MREDAFIPGKNDDIIHVAVEAAFIEQRDIKHDTCVSLNPVRDGLHYDLLNDSRMDSLLQDLAFIRISKDKFTQSWPVDELGVREDAFWEELGYLNVGWLTWHGNLLCDLICIDDWDAGGLEMSGDGTFASGNATSETDKLHLQRFYQGARGGLTIGLPIPIRK